MSRLEGIRLVNIHANHNTIIYPDELFNIDGKNTIIDMKNGGGKTLAVQMMFQTVLPNSYFSDKNKIINLFNGVPPGSAVHCISHFSIEGMQFKNLYLGFVAILKPTIDDSNEEGYDDDPSLKYMNYIIFGDNVAADGLSIDTIPLSKSQGDKVQILGYGDLKKYLQNKMRSENNGRKYFLNIFENKKNPYYNELKKYGINSEVFELLREINKDENYIKLFFEENCKNARDLLVSFIIPHTEKALDAKAYMMDLEKIDKSDQLAESLYEKSQSLNKLNAFHADKLEYVRMKIEIGNVIDFINTKQESLISFDEHLKEYPKQTALYNSLVDNFEDSIRKIQSSKIEIDKQVDNLKIKLTNIELKEIFMESLELKERLEEAEERLHNKTEEIESIKKEYRRLEAINTIIDYKRHESNKISIDEKLEKLTSSYYDEMKTVSQYANTLIKLCNDELSTLRSERLEQESVLKDKDLFKDKLITLKGEINAKTDQVVKEIKELNDKINFHSNDLNDLLNKLGTFRNYSGVLIDSDEYEAVNQFIKENSSTLELLEEEIKSFDNEIISIQLQNKELDTELKNKKERYEEKTREWNKYLNSLETAKSNSGIIEEEFEIAIKEKREQVKSNVEKILLFNYEIKEIEDEIVILQDYGFLRSRSKYDALNYLKGDWKYAEFGSELLKTYDKERVEHILSIFPGFAEVLIVSDEDYRQVSAGKKRVSISIAKENLILMARSTAQYVEKLKFSDIFLLTPNKDYYKALLDSKEAIEERERKIQKIEKAIAIADDENQVLEHQIDILNKHISRYPRTYVLELEKIIRSLNEYISTTKNQLTVNENLIIDLNLKKENKIQKKENLNEEINIANTKKELLARKIEILRLLNECTALLNKRNIEKANYKKDYETNESSIKLVISEVENISKSLKRIDDNIALQNRCLEEVNSYENPVYGYLEDTSIQETFERFKVAKRKFDTENESYEDLSNQQAKLEQIMEELREDYKVLEFGFDVLYSLNYLEKAKTQEFEAMNTRIKSLETIKSNLEEERNNAHTNYKISEKTLKEKEINRTVYYEMLNDLDKQQLSNLRKETENSLLRIEGEKNKLIQRENEIFRELNVSKGEFDKYKGFCDARQLTWLNTTCSFNKLPYKTMISKYEELKDEHDRSMNKINMKIKQLDSSIENLRINEQVKQKLKGSLVKKNSLEEIDDLIILLQQTIKSIAVTIRNIEISIEHIGKLDEEIALQVFRMLKTILDEVAKIPEYSKFKSGDYTRESFTINLTEGEGCRVENDIAINRIKSYIYELAGYVQSESLTKKEVKNRLSIKNLLHFVIDFERLQIKILKIEEGKPKYYDWGRLSASSGQGYVTYVMFAITMIKYYNNVTQIRERTKAPIFIFLDNPFSSASALELWEPVRRFLDKSNAQLLCVAHKVPSSAQILFDKHILVEQQVNSSGQFINLIRNEKTEAQDIIQMNLLDHFEIE